ncbi:uncharacterized protein ARMOST_15969 [Armillaria ostoyae]|uniref:Uncharacterized protein n=1 Tax=Armillaria ostoyae TaxID=47428 RepID=A0A284RUV8_ARMOS|nr:uncharacterized protein ARMOST_15969 [Armillaria ostoyae]
MISRPGALRCALTLPEYRSSQPPETSRSRPNWQGGLQVQYSIEMRLGVRGMHSEPTLPTSTESHQRLNRQRTDSCPDTTIAITYICTISSSFSTATRSKLYWRMGKHARGDIEISKAVALRSTLRCRRIPPTSTP